MLCSSCGNDIVEGNECIEELLHDLVEPLKSGDTELVNKILAEYVWVYLGKIV